MRFHRRFIIAAALAASAASGPVAAVAAGRTVTYTLSLPANAAAVAQTKIVSPICTDSQATVLSVAAGGSPVKLPAQGFAASGTSCVFTIDYTGLVIPKIATLKVTFADYPGLGPLVRLAQIGGPGPDASIAYVVGIGGTNECDRVTLVAGGAPIEGITYKDDPVLGGCVARFSALGLNTDTLSGKVGSPGDVCPIAVHPTKAFFQSSSCSNSTNSIGGGVTSEWGRVRSGTPSPTPVSAP